MGRLIFNIPLLVFLLFTTGFTKGSTVSYRDVRKTMTKMFAYHVENKALTSSVVERSVRIYFEQFDPYREYLLDSEVSPFLGLSKTAQLQVIRDYQNDEYPLYIQASETMLTTIHRHREIRKQVWVEFIEGSLDKPAEVDFTGYASSEEALAKRIHCRYATMLWHFETRNGGNLSKEAKKKIVKRFESKIAKSEKPYLHPNSHQISVRILKAMAKSLDAHSAYYTPEEARELRTALKKQFEGLGVVLRERDDGIVVVDLITGSPAEKSGKIQVGDYLQAVDQHTTGELSFEEVLDILKENNKAKALTLTREGGAPFTVSLKPESIVLHDDRVTYSTEKYGDGVILKIKLPGFYDSGDGVNAEADLRQVFREVKGQGTVYGLIIDMRDNSGGFLTQAVKVASLFVNKGIIVISKYSDGEIRYIRDVDSKVYFQGPMLLLTSKASASAAEILAQALQDYGVALVVGDERTYGKGSMQYQTVTLDNADAYFKVTVGRYYTISGRSTQIEGVRADIEVPTLYSSLSIGERYLDNPLTADRLDFSRIGQGDTELDRQLAPYFERKETRWQAMLPTLTRNSQMRVDSDSGYQCFLRTAQNREFSSLKSRCGDVDYQMRESVNILKDMIELSR